jgi:hypothetical protein
MKKLLLTIALLACLNGQARKLTLNQPTLESSCISCDSSQVVPWGDGTDRFIIGLQGAGYDSKTFVRLTWQRFDGVSFAFDLEPDADGSWSCVWTDMPVGDYVLSASQPISRFKFADVAAIAVEIF